MTHFFYANPSFVEGMARTLDIGDTLTVFNDSMTPEEADYRALKADWVAVGEDIKVAIEGFAKDHGQETEE